MIEVKNLTKRYAGRTAVRDISFSVAPGEIVAIGQRIGSDLRHLPRLLLSFLIFVPQRFFRPKKEVGR